MADAASPNIGLSPMVQPITRLPPGVHPGFVVGESDRVHDTRTVAFAVHCRVDLKIGDRDFSGDLCLHEIVLMRRFYEEQTGSIAINTSWPPGLRRITPLTQEQLQAELARLKVTCIIPQQNRTLDITSLFYGTEPAEQLKRLHEVMRKQLEAWGKVVEIAKARVKDAEGLHPEILFSLACDHITPKELEDVANIADPSKTSDGIDFVLPEVVDPDTTPPPLAVMDSGVMAPLTPTLADLEAQANAEIDGKGEDPLDALIGRLKAVGLEETQALTLASLVDSAGSGVTLADDDIVRVLGSKAKLAGVKKALKG